MTLRAKINLLVLVIALSAIIMAVAFALIAEYSHLERVDAHIAGALEGMSE